MSNKIKSQIVRDAIRRLYRLPTKTIARNILATHGELFDNDLEKIRNRVRTILGKNGSYNRKSLSDKSLFGDRKVKMPVTWRKIRTPFKVTPGLWLILSDIHIPYHEPKPIEAAFQAGQAEKVDGVFINGDLMDCAAIGYWGTAHKDFNSELEATIDFLDLLRQEFPKQKIIYKPGNHEYRLPQYFVTKAPDLAESPLAAMETVLGCEERNIEFLDYHQIAYFGRLPVIHGHEIKNITRAVNPARGLFLKAKTFSACSHCHSASEHTPKTIEGKLLTTWSFACLCDLNPDWNPFGNDWGWGYALINIEKDGNFEVENKRVLHTGKVV